jgi:hypothetical protein
MAEFCRQCQWEIFDEEYSDFDHFGRNKPPLEPGYGYPALCEGCGPTLVDDTGACMADDCLAKGHPRYARKMSLLRSKPRGEPDSG